MKSVTSGVSTTLLFALGLLLASALLFNIQPMIGKMLLPKVGGAPAVWNAAMAFFQIALLVGYLLAHLMGKLSARLHGLLYLVLLAMATVQLPISLPLGWQPDMTSAPALAILFVLCASVALPFIVLSTTAPTLQRLFASTTAKGAKDPYFLYAASNAGSFIGLLAYPLILEPIMTVSEQTHLWKFVYFSLMGLVIACLLWREAVVAPPAAVVADGPVDAPAAPNWAQKRQWILLALVPSSLTLGVTTHITTDVSAMPLLWAAILGIYLLTFIIAFSGSSRLKLDGLYRFQPFLIAFAAINFFPGDTFSNWLAMVSHLVIFFLTALACHKLLADVRPHPRHLTQFYLWISVGGALGGSFNAFIAPLIFSRPYEYMLMLLVSLMLSPLALQAMGAGARKYLAMGIAVLAVLGLNIGLPHQWLPYLSIALMAAGAVWLVLRAQLFILALVLVLSGIGLFWEKAPSIYVERNFFGVVRVQENLTGDEDVGQRVLIHGSTVHGLQLLAEKDKKTPTTYYWPESGIGLAMAALKPQKALLIGLGAGTLGCYAGPGQSFTFYEIDPLMIHVANEYFTFTTDCPAPLIKLGDGRLLLQQDNSSYNMIVLDAFSSDAIPVHLLTTEAFAQYKQHLAPGGVLMVHISNRFFELRPLVTKAGAEVGFVSAFAHVPVDEAKNPSASPSTWMALASSQQTLDKLGGTPWIALQPSPKVRPWTDDYSSLIGILK